MTLPKTYDDMVLRWPFMAWLYFGSLFISGVFLLLIAEQSESSPWLEWSIRSIGFVCTSYVVFVSATHIVQYGDALGFIGAFEKKDKHK